MQTEESSLRTFPKGIVDALDDDGDGVVSRDELMDAVNELTIENKALKAELDGIKKLAALNAAAEAERRRKAQAAEDAKRPTVDIPRALTLGIATLTLTAGLTLTLNSGVAPGALAVGKSRHAHRASRPQLSHVHLVPKPSNP